MDFSNPALLISGMLISTVGFGLFMYGKKAQEGRSLGIGLALMVFPFFVHSVLWTWLLAGACAAGWYVMPRLG